MPIDSIDYRFYQSSSQDGSINHPSFDKGSFRSFSTLESLAPPTQTKSEPARPPRSCSSRSDKAISVKSEPIKKTTFMPLTEHTLAIHNNIRQPFKNHQRRIEKENLLEESLLNKVNERCDDIQHDIEEKIKQLEAQFAKAELDFDQSRNELIKLSSMEKEYLNQGVQTELNVYDLDNAEKDLIHSKEQAKEWKYKAEGLQDFVNQTKKIIWDTPFIPVNAICRQLPTAFEDVDDDESICDYHRERIEKYRSKLEKERDLYREDNHATLQRMSNWSTTIKHV